MKNLLTMALECERSQWHASETVWLVPKRVFLKNEDCLVRLCLVGFNRACTIFWLDPYEGRWKIARDAETHYARWSKEAQAWLATTSTPAKGQHDSP